MVDRFWERVQMYTGVIPHRAMALLDLFELSASLTLADPISEWPECMEAQIKLCGDTMFEEARSQGLTHTRSELFGRHENDLAHYVMQPVVASAIRVVRKLIQQHGIRTFITESPAQATRRRQTGNEQECVIGAEASDEIKRPLLDQIANYYETHNELGIRRNMIANLSVCILEESPTQMTVRVQCVKCRRKPKCTRNEANWLTGNYYQHVRTHLKNDATVEDDQPTPTRRNRKRRSVGARSVRISRRRQTSRRVTNMRQSLAASRRLPSPTSGQDEENGEDGWQDTQGELPPPTASLQGGDPTNSEPAPSCSYAVDKQPGTRPRRGKSVSELIEKFSSEGTSRESFGPQRKSTSSNQPTSP